jgi:hypothetical protein
VLDAVGPTSVIGPVPTSTLPEPRRPVEEGSTRASMSSQRQQPPFTHRPAPAHHSPPAAARAAARLRSIGT